MIQYEEYKIVPPPWHWILMILLCVTLVGWGLWIYYVVDDAPRQWDFGALPDTPAGSIYSTEIPREVKSPPRQVTPLPEAQPIERARQ